MYFVYEFLNFRHAALINQVAVVRLTRCGLAVDGGEHQLAHLLAVMRKAECPAQLDVGGFGQHVVGGDDAAEKFKIIQDLIRS